MILYHWTAAHLAAQILEGGAITPQPQPAIAYRLYPAPIIWLTDLEETDEQANGLTSRFISYSRLAVRFELDLNEDEVLKFHRYASLFQMKATWRNALTKRGRIDAHHWFVTGKPLPVTERAATWFEPDPRPITTETEGAEHDHGIAHRPQPEHRAGNDRRTSTATAESMGPH